MGNLSFKSHLSVIRVLRVLCFHLTSLEISPLSLPYVDLSAAQV
jgi:hypothetical protein